jgi:MFS family permease
MTRSQFWMLLVTSALVMAVTTGLRQSLGLFVSPLNTSTGLGIAGISFALAVGQFVLGAAQPIFGALADRVGSFRVVVMGALLLSLGLALTPFAHSQFALVLVLGVVTAAGAGAGSFSILLAVAAQRVPPEKRSFTAGFINAGGSFGQFVFAPFAQAMIGAVGWIGALWALAGSALLTIPLGLPLREGAAQRAAKAALTGMTLREQLHIAARDKSYWLLQAGFFTCGFHIAFLVTHLPGEVVLCGLPASVSATSLAIIGLANIVGSLSIGWLGGRYRMKWLLFWLYAFRAVSIVAYLLAPKTALTFYIFAVALGVSWLATVPPTAGLVGKLFGPRYLATLFGLALLTHQVGAFFGAWLGGLAVASTGNYDWMWKADIALAVLAALVNVPIHEERIVRGPLVAAPARAS